MIYFKCYAIPKYAKTSLVIGQTQYRAYEDLKAFDTDYAFYSPLYRDYELMNFGKERTGYVKRQLNEYRRLLGYPPNYVPRAEWEKILFWTYFYPYYQLQTASLML
eukprot:TRINITY_DN105109_c0_g1_i1.p7 TRINITY_DN105109_c0_g1~~TRINITY_DN105109_c0_g1_i1.p7  ORF type:complete len:106 (-),score=2.20 TRINITY_DN105109_c0_g1_i1:69-386(-)